MGCFAVTFKKAPSLIKIYQNNLIQELTQLVQVGDEELNRNVAFCLGVMASKSSESMAPFINQVLGILKNIFEKSQDQACKDNVAAALIRILRNNTQAIPA